MYVARVLASHDQLTYLRVRLPVGTRVRQHDSKSNRNPILHSVSSQSGGHISRTQVHNGNGFSSFESKGIM